MKATELLLDGGLARNIFLAGHKAAWTFLMSGDAAEDEAASNAAEDAWCNFAPSEEDRAAVQELDAELEACAHEDADEGEP